MENYWDLAEVWNNAFDRSEVREYKPRDYVYATELGKSNIDIYLALKGEKPSNAPDGRAQRKFEAGNYFESLVKVILLRAGILIAEQVPLRKQIEGMVMVSGRLDFLAGGQIDWEKARKFSEAPEFSFLPEKSKEAFMQIIDYLALTYPAGMPRMIMDLKSCSASMFENYLRMGHGSESHMLQVAHYLISSEMPLGRLDYLCRDDLRLISYPVVVEDIRPLYEKRLKEITEMLKKGEPEKEKEIVWNPDLKKFQANWKVQYSNYLTKVYGYGNENEFGTPMRKKANRWNGAIKRIKEGKEPTKGTAISILEITKEYDITKLLSS